MKIFLPFYIPKRVKSLPFYITEALKRYPFQAEPPPPPGHQIKLKPEMLSCHSSAHFITTKVTYTSITQVYSIPDLMMDALILRVTLYISTMAKRFKIAQLD